MSMRRFSRLTDAFSKEIENHEATRLHYILCITTSARVHRRDGFTPAMEAGLAHHVWPLEELVGLLRA